MPIVDTGNPYDFVPFEDGPSYIEDLDAIDQARNSGYTGEIVYSIEVLTPLCVFKDPGNGKFARLGDQPIIPATSIKGMLRNVYEVVTNSRMGVLTLENLQDKGERRQLRNSGKKRNEINAIVKPAEARERQRWLSQLEPRAYLPNKDVNRLTSAEALFGKVGAEGETSSGRAGRLFISDVSVTLGKPIRLWRPRGAQPSPSHKPFYMLNPAGYQMLGRKFYFHQDWEKLSNFYREDREEASEESPLLETVTPKNREHREGTSAEAPPLEMAASRSPDITGTLRFFNLQRAELAALIYTIELEPDLAHKLGYGKPIGLGSVRLKIISLKTEQTNNEKDIPDRFWSYDRAELKAWQPDEIADLKAEALDVWIKNPQRPKGKHSYAQFRAIAYWQDTVSYAYPDYRYFRNARTTSESLPDYQQSHSAPTWGAAGVPLPTLIAVSDESAGSPTSSIAAPPMINPVTTAAPSAAQETPMSLPEALRQPVDFGQRGKLGGIRNGRLFIEGHDGAYLVLPESATEDVLHELQRAYQDDRVLNVRFIADRRKVDGKYQKVALDIDIIAEGGV